MRRTLDPARHRRFRLHLPARDVLADAAITIARPLDTLRRIGPVASGMAEVIAARHDFGVHQRGRRELLVPAQRLCGIEFAGAARGATRA